MRIIEIFQRVVIDKATDKVIAIYEVEKETQVRFNHKISQDTIGITIIRPYLPDIQGGV